MLCGTSTLYQLAPTDAKNMHKNQLADPNRNTDDNHFIAAKTWLGATIRWRSPHHRVDHQDKTTQDNLFLAQLSIRILMAGEMVWCMQSRKLW